MKSIKSLAILMALLIAIAPLSVVAMPTTSISVGTVSGNRGDTVSVSVSIGSGSKMQAFSFCLLYDKEVVEVVSATKGKVLSATPIINTNVSGKIVFSYAATSAVSSSGTVLDISFKIKEDAPFGHSEIKLIVNEFADGSFASIDHSVKNGQVVVLAPKLEAPAEVQLKELGDIYAEIMWTGNDEATGYNIYLNGSLYNDTPWTDNVYHFFELEQNTKYEVQITSLHYTVESDKTEVFTFQTNKTVYDVMFVDWNFNTLEIVEGSVLYTTKAEYGTAVNPPENPVREGYKFISWDKDFSCVTSDLVIQAQYEPIVCMVSFVDWDGTVLLQQTVPYGGAAEAPATPSRDGYVFTTWNKPFNNVKEDLTIQAQYEKIICEHWNTKVQGSVESTCQTPGFAGNVICTDCGEIISVGGELELADHSYQAVVTPPTSSTQGFTTHTCTVCGDQYVDSYVAPAVKPILTLKSPTLEFKDMITVNAFYTAENIQNVVEMGMITYSTKVSAVDIATAEHVIPGATYVESSGRYYSCSQGIHAKYLGDTVYLAIYAKLSDGSYVYSKLAGYSAVQYAASQLKNSTDAKLKQLVVAMLNYGAEAQLYFGHNTDTLANASISADQKALPESYRADMVKSVPSPSAVKQGVFVNNLGFASRKPAISFEGAFCINYFFTPKYAPSSGVTLYYWNAEDYAAADVLTAANATGKIKLEGSGTGEYRGDITGIAAKELSSAVYVAAAYKNGSNVWTSGVLGYSIGTYCSSQASKGGSIAGLAQATAVYGYHAKQYFG